MSAKAHSKAAARLREQALQATTPPWEARPGPLEGHWVAGAGGNPHGPVPGLIGDDDAAYIATADPGVGLAVAHLLEMLGQYEDMLPQLVAEAANQAVLEVLK